MEFIEMALPKMKYERVVVVLHNLDGPGLLDVKTQGNLARLFATERLSLVASIDNVRFPTLLTPDAITSFNFLWIPAHTYDVFDNEVNPTETLLQNKGEKGMDSLKFIFKSLNQNQKEVLKVMAEYHLRNPEERGLTMSDLLHKSIGNMIVSNETQLKEILLELVDHKVIVERRGEGAVTYLGLNLSKQNLAALAKGEMEE
eukprot:TRINITY_DN7324_c0_g1_i4.p1 TRINITY_DN7324_c0_g1~~TRINITY_DN7324_c0_g1_i4.p1  ORF type:complete len:201 (+),score=70.04 TRINITY_DN7324_c0_g1_i4:677-1279(+)